MGICGSSPTSAGLGGGDEFGLLFFFFFGGIGLRGRLGRGSGGIGSCSGKHFEESGIGFEFAAEFRFALGFLEHFPGVEGRATRSKRR